MPDKEIEPSGETDRWRIALTWFLPFLALSSMMASHYYALHGFWETFSSPEGDTTLWEAAVAPGFSRQGQRFVFLFYFSRFVLPAATLAALSVVNPSPFERAGCFLRSKRAPPKILVIAFGLLTLLCLMKHWGTLEFLNRELDVRNSQLSGQVNELRRERDNLATENSDLASTVEKLESELKTKNEELEEATTDNLEQAFDIATLEAELKKLKATSAAEKVRELESSQLDLAQKAHKLENENGQLRTEIARLKANPAAPDSAAWEKLIYYFEESSHHAKILR